MTVPAYKILWSSEDTEAMHFRRYTLRGIKKKLKEAGFEPVFSTYLFSFLLLPIFLFRTLPGIFGIVKTGKQKINKDHHVAKKGITHKILATLLSFEVKRLENERTIPFGSSCLVVARRKHDTV